MLFKTTALAAEFIGLHPRLRRLLLDLDAQVAEWGLEPVVVTHVLRTPEQQADFYWKDYAGPACDEDAAREKARRRFSWHCCNCAVDIRYTHWSPDERKRVRVWLLSKKVTRPLWENLEHDVGRGEHWHLAFCDFVRRREYEQSLRKVEGAAV